MGVPAKTGRRYHGRGEAASSGPCRRLAYGSCHASMANRPPWPSWSMIAAPSAWTASTIGDRRAIFSGVSTHVIPGEVRPSGWMHDEPWMMRPTP